LKDGAYWTLHPIGCTNILIDGITIDSDLKIPNCDGIDPDRCQDVRIANCSITCADDCIVLKTTKYFPQYGPCERITVTNCNLVSTSAALKIGTESVADFRDVIFTNCTITRSSRGIALQLRDQGSIDGVIISNVVIETRLFEDHWWGKAEPIYITALPRYSVEGRTTARMESNRYPRP
jgi:polygalacturonase